MENWKQEVEQDCQKMKEFMQNAAENPQADMKGMLDINKRLFGNLKTALEKGSPKEKEEALAVFGKVAEFFTEQLKNMVQKSFFTEKGLKTLASSPHFFSKEQLKVLEDLKTSMKDLETEIKGALPKE